MEAQGGQMLWVLGGEDKERRQLGEHNGLEMLREGIQHTGRAVCRLESEARQLERSLESGHLVASMGILGPSGEERQRTASQASVHESQQVHLQSR